MTFQQHILERLERSQVVPLLETLQDVSNTREYSEDSDVAKRGGFKLTNYDFNTYSPAKICSRADAFTNPALCIT
jgi:hypothetical protein